MKNITTVAFIFTLLTFPIYADPFPFDPPKNFALDPACTLVDHPVKTDSKEAQSYFNQGMTFLYAFNQDAAYWSFKKASEIDPNMPMAYWGMALALGPNINTYPNGDAVDKAMNCIHEATKLSENGTNNEKEYIQALTDLYSKDPKNDKKLSPVRYSNAMKKVMQDYPDDLDAAVLFAGSLMDISPWNQWDANGEPLGQTLELISILESVLKVNPLHVGANHYYIHAIEGSTHPERALMSAERLRKMNSHLGHIVHMPGHIYILVGDYHLVVQCNEEAVTVDRDYIRKYGLAGTYPVSYLTHELNFLSRGYIMEGNYSGALRSSRELVEFYLPHYQDFPSLEYYITGPMFTYLQFHKWKEITALPLFPDEMKISNILLHYARGYAFAALKQKDQAIDEQKIFEQGLANLPANATYGGDAAEGILTVAQYLLNSKISEIDQKMEDSIQALSEGVALQDKMGYNGLADWFFPLREILGEFLLQNKQYAEAEKIFRLDLEKHPRNGRSLYGLKLSLEGQNKITDAVWIERAFQKAWENSDITPKEIFHTESN